MKRSIVSFALVLLLSSSLIGFVEAKSPVIKVVTTYPVGDESYVTAQAFAERVKEYSQGAIEVQVFHSGSMGGEKDTVQAVKLGSAQVVTCGLLPVTMFTQDYAFFDGIYVFKDFEHFNRVWDGKPGQGIQEILLKNNLRAMGIYQRGVRQLAANKEVTTPADAKGLKLRVPQIPSWVKVFQTIGFLPTPVALSELFTAMQTGVVDSAEGPPSQMVSYKYNEVEKYLMMTSHNISVAMLLVNDKWLQKLDDETRGIVEKAATEAIAEGAKYTQENADKLVKQLVDGGMTMVEPDRDAFIEAARPALEELFATEWKTTTWDEIMSYAD